MPLNLMQTRFAGSTKTSGVFHVDLYLTTLGVHSEAKQFCQIVASRTLKTKDPYQQLVCEHLSVHMSISIGLPAKQVSEYGPYHVLVIQYDKTSS